jgi:hypothetical protein
MTNVPSDPNDVGLDGRFPPYRILDRLAGDTRDRTRKLERLYHQTQAQSWDPKKVLDELEQKHGGIRLPDDKKEAVGHLFTVLLWGELAAWNIAADLARHLPDPEAKMAATGQVFDEARHFTVLRDYLARAGVELPELNPYGRRVLVKILETDSLLQKLYGMQLLVENMALAIFRRLADSNIEPVLTDLLAYVERDESRHVALGVLYLPRLLARTTPLERARNWVFNVELFLLTIAGGQLLDPHFQAMGVDHRELGFTTMRLHQQVIRQMGEELGLPKGASPKGVYGLTSKQHALLNDFLHPEKPDDITAAHRFALGTFDRAVHAAVRLVA